VICMSYINNINGLKGTTAFFILLVILYSCSSKHQKNVATPDIKYLITINANGYDNTGDIGLYSIENKAIKLIMSAAFKNWMPASEKENSFWSSDGYLYVPVIHAQVSANADGPLTGNYQYIRIRVL
jgi:hypothetical protein